jgi:hypothetical protein
MRRMKPKHRHHRDRQHRFDGRRGMRSQKPDRPLSLREMAQRSGHSISKDLWPADEAFETAIANLQVAWRHSRQGRRTAFERAAWQNLIEVTLNLSLGSHFSHTRSRRRTVHDD